MKLLAAESHVAKQLHGFTLAELLVTIAVLGILMMVAVPAFDSALLNGKLTAQTNAFVSSLHLARSEAMKRNTRVALCKSTDGEECVTGGGWEQGWIVFHDASNNGVRDEGEAIIQRSNRLSSGFSLTGDASVSIYISYDASGATRLTSGDVQTGTLMLCRSSPLDVSRTRQIMVLPTGHPRVSRDHPAPFSCPPG
jgi:type IV fimbrial biogenesis protein FimT